VGQPAPSSSAQGFGRRAGPRIEKTFDALNRMTRMVLKRAGGAIEDDHNFAYDDLGQKTLAYDYDSSLGWAYDGANRVASAAVHAGPGLVQPATVLTHAWNAVGDRTSLSDTLGGIISYRGQSCIIALLPRATH
jgi:hypothetical protein